MPHDSAAIRTTTTASTVGLSSASPPDAKSSTNGDITRQDGMALKKILVALLSTVPEQS